MSICICICIYIYIYIHIHYTTISYYIIIIIVINIIIIISESRRGTEGSASSRGLAGHHADQKTANSYFNVEATTTQTFISADASRGLEGRHADFYFNVETHIRISLLQALCFLFQR